jgi:hypothetical protein
MAAISFAMNCVANVVRSAGGMQSRRSSISVSGSPSGGGSAGGRVMPTLVMFAVSWKSAGGMSISKVTDGVGMACVGGWFVGRKASLVPVVVKERVCG